MFAFNFIFVYIIMLEMIFKASCSGVAELANMTKLRVLNLKDNSFSFLSVQGKYVRQNRKKRTKGLMSK